MSNGYQKELYELVDLLTCLAGCGVLDWTLRKYGRVTHKDACDVRVEPYCQTHPKGCPPQEALRYALTCRTCGGRGMVDYFDRQRLVEDEEPCPNCIDGIPREWVEAVAENLLPVQVWINQNGEPYHQSWVGASAGQRDWARDIALELLLALRDKEDQWPV